MSIVYFDGHFLPFNEVGIPLSDRGFQFGDGVFATIQVCEGIPLFLEMHLKQLETQCCSFNLILPYIGLEIIEELIQLNQATKGIWRLKIMITGGDTTEVRLPKRTGRVVILILPFQPLKPYPLRLALFPTPFYLCHATFKSLAHLNRFYLMEEANRQGVDDCLTLTERGIVLEAAFGNLLWVKEKTLYTPDPTLPLYFGVTIKNVVQVAQEAGFQIKYVQYTLMDIPDQACCFRVNTMNGIWPIAQLAERTFSRNKGIETLLVEGYEGQKGRHRVAMPLNSL